ncbi:MAG TPA: prepilin-type N-terminal cleavage/methylation domain-containing protein [Thermomonas sp.]|nr:prepilin-type N-terminal cleavage/methylation domain-containing protein [Thermomonas sp.]
MQRPRASGQGDARGFGPTVGHGPRVTSRRGGSAAKAAGFTLLEAIVALVVFSMGAFALYGWLSTNIITLERIRDRQEIEAAMHSALDIVRRTNPMETPSGQRQAGTLLISWTSEPLESLRPNVDQSGWPGFYTVGLYEATVRVMRDGQELQVFRVRQIGWKQVRAGGES